MAMARTRTEEEEEDDEETLLISHRNQEQEDEEEEEEEEETLSLCDLPVNLSNEQVQFHKQQPKEEEKDFEFETGSSVRFELAPADKLFSEGRIIPLRHSLSLDAGLSDSNRLNSRSESIKIRRTISQTYHRTGSDRKIRNNFLDYSQPSPQPQIRRSSSMTARVNTKSSSSIWDFLRLGLVRTPEIELRTTKMTVSRNSSCSSTSTKSSNSKKAGKKNRRSSLALFGDCKSSVSIVSLSSPVEMNEEKQRMKKTKKAIARKRTFEWLKELSHVEICR